MVDLVKTGISIITGFILSLVAFNATAHDSRYAEKHPLTKEQHKWFDNLQSGKGLCCSNVDGSVLTDADWKTKDGHYQVFIDDQWRDVPDDAVIKGPNLYGPTMVWPIRIWNNATDMRIEIRCFIVGTLM